MTIVTREMGAPREADALQEGSDSGTVAPFSPGGAGLTVVEGAGGGPITVESSTLLLYGSYARDGNDLILTDGAGHGVVVRDYFATTPPPALTTGEGVHLDGATVSHLAGSPTPGMVAQAGAAAGTAEAIGSVTKVTGEVTIVHPDGTRETPKAGDPVFQGDVVETQADGAIGITFVDGSAFSLSSRGRMVLDELVYDPSSGEGSSSVSLVAGVFSFVSGGIARSGPDAMTVTTPVATIGIRGTVGVIKIAVPEGADLGDLDAMREILTRAGVSVEVTLLPNADGSTGEILFVPMGGQPQVLNVPYDAVRATLGQIADTIQTTIERYSANPDSFRPEGENGRALDYLPPGSTSEGSQGDQGQQGPQGQQGQQDSGQDTQQASGTGADATGQGNPEEAQQAAQNTHRQIPDENQVDDLGLVDLFAGSGDQGTSGSGGQDNLGGGTGSGGGGEAAGGRDSTSFDRLAEAIRAFADTIANSVLREISDSDTNNDTIRAPRTDTTPATGGTDTSTGTGG
ncbi:FecR family protein, partial [Pararhodospirillum oryzae]|uniref:FecR family protein n=1 Tax=Pararhodospirillum oryzae TaxID=478448 RepID=UPI0011BE65A0